MVKAGYQHKEKNYRCAMLLIQNVQALDWKKAATEWLERRKRKWDYTQR